MFSFRPDSQDFLPMGLVIPGRTRTTFNTNEYSFAQAPKDTALPLKSTSMTAKLTGYVVAMSSVFKYSNDTQNPVEVLFRFPVDESYAVVGLEAIIGSQKIKATLKEKEEAKQNYDDAIASGFTAALGEEKTRDIFSISLGNLLPQSSAEIHLELVGELPLNAEGGVHFTLPSVLKPRHVSAGSVNPLQMAGFMSGGVFPQQVSAPAVFDFNLHILNPSLISTVSSPTHSVFTQRNEDAILVSLGQPQPLESDLVISVIHTDPHAPSVVIEHGNYSLSQRSYMGSPAVMLNFFPKFDTKQAACEFIFLIDRSGSMSGGYMRSAKETLKLFLKSIPSGCRFNIVGFGSRYEVVFSGSVAYTQDNLDFAVSKTDKMFANLGGTELLPPLKYINSQPALSGLPRQMFVLTDGAVSNTAACIEEVKKHTSHTRVFTFGIGSGASTELVKGLARAGNGKAEFIQEGERMQPKVIASLKRALQPAVTDFEVVFDLPSGFKPLQAPENLPVFYNGEKTTIFGILKSTALSDDPLQTSVEGSATLRGKILGQPFDFLLPFKVPESTNAKSLTVVHQLAAKALIKDWEDDSSSKNKQDVVNLSIESSVISSHTAYVAIDENQDKPIEGAIKVWDILATAPQESAGTLFGGSSLFGSNLYHMQGGPPPPMGGGAMRGGAMRGGFGFSNNVQGPVDMLSYSVPTMPASLSPQYRPTSPASNSSPLISRSPAGSQSKAPGGSAVYSEPFSDGLFGAPPPPSVGLLGAPPRPPSGGSFGVPPPGPPSGRLFGAPSFSSGGLFGAPPPGPPSGGLFGGPQSSSGTSFGSTQSGGLFGGPPPCPPSSSGRLFGGPSPGPLSGGSCGLFGGPSPGPLSGGSFGGPPPPSGGLFGGPSPPMLAAPLAPTVAADLSTSSAFNFSLGGSSMSREGDHDLLTKIISLQKAEGFWLLEEVTTQIIPKSLAELTSCCPVECDKRAWATALVLACLEKKFGTQKDEWELVAIKAELWLEQIAEKSTFNKLTEAAKNVTV